MKDINELISKVHNVDCLEFMKQLPDKCIDLVITSPPYNMGGISFGNQKNSTVGQKLYDEYTDNKKEIEYINWNIVLIKECLRISRYVFWNIQYIRPTRNLIYDIQNKYRSKLKDIFIWKKQATSSINSKRGSMSKGYEYVFMLGEDDKSLFDYNNFSGNCYVPNIQTWFKKERFNEHHATFPVELPEYFIEYFTKDDNIVFDPFLGSGTTAVACERLGRRWIGCEISPEYVKIAEERIKREKDQLKLAL